MNKFGQHIRNVREERKLLLRRLASEIDIDTALLSKIERGERSPKKEQVVKLIEYLSLDKSFVISLWLADKLFTVVKDDDNALTAVNIVKKEIEMAKSKRK